MRIFSGVHIEVSIVTTFGKMCVQFYLFPQASPEAMAAVVLAEVPGQLTEYMRKNGIAPKGRPQ